MPRPRLHARPLPAIASLVGPAALAASAMGAGVRSLAVVPLALCVLLLVRKRAPRTALGAALLTFALLVALHTARAGLPPAGDAVLALSLLLAVITLPVWVASRTAAPLEVARRRTEQLERFLGGSEPPIGRARLAHGGAGRDVTGTSSLEDRPPADSLEAILRLARDHAGAEEAMFFRFTRERDALESVAWASEAATPVDLRPDWHGLVEWTAREQRFQCEAAEGVPAFAAAPVPGDRAPLGCLCLFRGNGLSLDRAALASWLPKYAEILGRTAELLDARRRLADASRRAELVLRNVEEFQTQRTPEELGRLICAAALQISGGDEAVLVRWYRDETRGEIASASSPDVAPAGLAVDADSLVAEICRGGLPQVWENARLATEARHLFGADDAVGRVASLGIYPLKNRDRQTVGAIVVQGRAAGTIRYPAMRDLRLLSLYAAMSLETVWEIAEVSRRARTDQLTGLNNRRWFDEKLAEQFAQSDRSGRVMSLLIADIDHFKRVNDTHGHEAGDAVLRAVARVFQDTVRETDVCARFGGEEIAVLLPDTPIGGALELGERLRRAIEERVIRFGAKEIPVTASFGVAAYPESAASREGFFPAADKALYEAKREGRNRVKCAPVLSSRKTT